MTILMAIMKKDEGCPFVSWGEDREEVDDHDTGTRLKKIPR